MTAARTGDLEASVTPELLAFRAALRDASAKPLSRFRIGALDAELRVLGDALWLIVRRGNRGGAALRAAIWSEDGKVRLMAADERETARVRVRSLLGEHIVSIHAASDALDLVRIITRFRPAAATRLPFVPRDCYAIGAAGDPLGARGHIEAAQCGLNAGLLYFRMEQPAAGNFLYFQNFTALADYFDATGTTPEETVGGAWPELGFRLPVPEPGDEHEVAPLPAGREIILSDAILVTRPGAPNDERDSARQFLQMLGAVYQRIGRPETDYHDWPARAERTLRDLGEAPEATIRHYGHSYVHPYTAAEYPDAMVQVSMVQAIHEWGRWAGTPHPLEAEFKAGLSRFYDAKLETLRRYLPNVGDDKDADAVDSWYLYHPLLNLGKLALHGDTKAKKLFLDSLGYGIRSAHHFAYKWPIQYKVGDFSVIEETAGADGRGQTDVGGIYAWVMLQAFELTDEKRFLDEACAAIDAAIGLGFGINYQANLTAWGAAACMRLWRVTNREVYLEQSYVYLASFFHHCEIWESRIGHAQHYRNFLGVTALQDAPYMALYECFDSFAAFEHYFADSGPDLEPAARMLIAEYCRYALDRAWYYYPDALPKGAIAEKQREKNGHVDRALSFPLEDLYADGQPAGQVGQEIYGAGAAFIFATRAFHPVEGAPFLLFCDHFVRASERLDDKRIAITLDGGDTCQARLSFVRRKRRKLPETRVAAIDGDALRPHRRSVDRIDFIVPANGRLILGWD
ncbi:hypothetical protein [Sphingopyxis sp.]|uniref:hypothetical protein n=1 Tax=Sphingopyxis sp. TaxID=1908224 RepID=UPI002D77A0F0|nr:hypothetical protein [Sphingopyxis sp.]HET6526867.1 hypothetical protein [Sphingopyxis sp.]